MPQNPTILVKKKDGTSVRMTMDEFRAYKKSNTEIVKETPVSNAGVPKDEPSVPRVQVIEDGKATIIQGSTPKKTSQPSEPKKETIVQREEKKREVFAPPLTAEKMKQEPRPMAKNVVQWSADDHKSPLDTSLHEDGAPVSQPVPSKTIDQRVVDIMNSIPFVVTPNVRGRLQSLLQSRVKEIRTDDQILHYFVRSEGDGGLGFTEEQAHQIIEKIHTVIAPKGFGSNRVLRPEKQQRAGEKITQPVRPTQNQRAVPLVNMPTPTRSILPGSVPQKTMVHDVFPGGEAKQSVGPIDELRNLTVEEFRRLGASVQERKDRLEAKFRTLEQESYLLYLDAKDAWKGSPLYKEYQTIILSALKDGKTIQDVALEKRGMTFEDIQALISVGKSLHV
ncbi:MAG TPA: hypothetical protein VEA18_04120 [Candidatus Kapabacteria bacterium]|nr:hypothetical protein [Candidatus Kapabacteria bacterium]